MQLTTQVVLALVHRATGSTFGPASATRSLCYVGGMTDDRTQADKFKEAGREPGFDDGDRFKERVKKLARHKPAEKPE